MKLFATNMTNASAVLPQIVLHLTQVEPDRVCT